MGMAEARNGMPRYPNEDVRRKMLELAIELRSLAADGQLNKPKFSVTLLVLLEACAQEACRWHWQMGGQVPASAIPGGVDNATAGSRKMTGGSMSDTALGIAAVEFREVPL